MRDSRNFSSNLFTSQNEGAKLVVDPDVDEEVGEVVDVDEVEEVAGEGHARVEREEKRGEGDDAHEEQTRADLRRLHVFCVFFHPESKYIISM